VFEIIRKTTLIKDKRRLEKEIIRLRTKNEELTKEIDELREELEECEMLVLKERTINGVLKILQKLEEEGEENAAAKTTCDQDTAADNDKKTDADAIAAAGR
jgi:predicted  nucleic acid-binding Zn-ribbon protein